MEETERERFAALYRLTCPRVTAYALRRAGSPEDAADVVAETFAIAWRHIDRVPAGDEALLWLYVTARGVLANEWRRSLRRSEVVKRVASSLAARDVPQDERRLMGIACLQQLSVADQELLMLSAWEGLNGSQLARVMGCSATTVRVRLHRARQRLEAVCAAVEAGSRVSLIPKNSPRRTDSRSTPEEAQAAWPIRHS